MLQSQLQELSEKTDLSFVRREGVRKAVEEVALHVTSEAGNPSVPNG